VFSASSDQCRHQQRAHDIGVLIPIRPVADWIADILRPRGYRVVIAESIADLVRTLMFIQLDTVITWLPRPVLRELTNLLQPHAQATRLIVLTWSEWAGLSIGGDRWEGSAAMVSLPLSPADVLEAMARPVHAHGGRTTVRREYLPVNRVALTDSSLSHPSG
jgi:hypothetical protein